MNADRTAHWTRRPKAEPCWGHDCQRPASPVQDTRWRGRYCRECERLVAADAARMEEES